MARLFLYTAAAMAASAFIGVGAFYVTGDDVVGHLVGAVAGLCLGGLAGTLAASRIP